MTTRAQSVVRKRYDARVKQAGERRRTFTISTKGVDREGDRVRFWELEQYRKNPVVLYAHQQRELPIAKAVSIEEQGDRLVSTAEFASTSFASTVLELVDEGMLGGASVGFRPVEPITRNEAGGFDMGAELLEWSVVPVPANPDALVQRAKAAGVDLRPLLEERERHLRRCAGPDCRSGSGDGFDPVDALLSLPHSTVRRLVRESIRDAWRENVTPVTGHLGP